MCDVWVAPRYWSRPDSNAQRFSCTKTTDNKKNKLQPKFTINLDFWWAVMKTTLVFDWVSHSAVFTWRPLLCSVWVIDKGNHIHSDFIMVSTDISSSVGYQDTWWETLFIQLNPRRRRRQRRRSCQIGVVCSWFSENHLKSCHSKCVSL